VTSFVLTGDIGGTKTLLGLFRVHGREAVLVRDATYPSRDFVSLEPIIRTFVEEGSPTIAAACFGVAGVVVDETVTTTNLPWTLDAKTLRHTIPSPAVTIINDLEATAWGIMHLAPAQLVSLQDGLVRRGHKALIAAGTGLGEALIIDAGERDVVIASEGGHVDFAPRTAAESALLDYLRGEFGHVSYERVLSGPGLLNIYRFLRDTRGRVEPGWLTDRLGRRAVIAVGIALLLTACAVAGTAGQEPRRLATGLLILGLGWSATLVSGSTLLSDAIPMERRASAQGFADLAMGLAGASAGALSGVVVGTWSYPALTLMAALATVPLIVALVPAPRWSA